MNGLSISHKAGLLPQLVVLAGLTGAFWEERWLAATACIGILLLMNLPLLLPRLSALPMPLSPGVQLLLSLLLFAWLFLGELHDYYSRFAWWDLFLHAFAGFVIGLIAFRLARVATEAGQGLALARIGFMQLFAVSLALALGAIWEILEFGLDRFLGWEVIKPTMGDPSGLTDTILDLIADALGAVVACCYGFFRMNRQT